MPLYRVVIYKTETFGIVLESDNEQSAIDHALDYADSEGESIDFSTEVAYIEEIEEESQNEKSI